VLARGNQINYQSQSQSTAIVGYTNKIMGFRRKYSKNPVAKKITLLIVDI
jgi:hypothetical protein